MSVLQTDPALASDLRLAYDKRLMLVTGRANPELASRIPAIELKRIALNPAQSNAIGETFGRKWARTCIAAGIKP